MVEAHVGYLSGKQFYRALRAGTMEATSIERQVIRWKENGQEGRDMVGLWRFMPVAIFIAGEVCSQGSFQSFDRIGR